MYNAMHLMTKIFIGKSIIGKLWLAKLEEILLNSYQNIINFSSKVLSFIVILSKSLI